MLERLESPRSTRCFNAFYSIATLLKSPCQITILSLNASGTCELSLIGYAHAFQTFSFTSMAGTDTTSISMSYFLWELTRRPDILRKLQSELDDAMPDAKVLPDINALNGLPYLNAFVKEGMPSLSLLCQN